MPSDEALRLAELLEPTLGDWLYEPAGRCAAGHENTDYECGPLAGVGEACPLCVEEEWERQWPWAADASEEQTFARYERYLELERRPDPTWVIARGAPTDLDDPDRLWSAWGRWLAAVGATAPTMQVYWAEPIIGRAGMTGRWVGAWMGPRYKYQHFGGETPAAALRSAWLAWLTREPAEARP